MKLVRMENKFKSRKILKSYKKNLIVVKIGSSVTYILLNAAWCNFSFVYYGIHEISIQSSLAKQSLFIFKFSLKPVN